MPNRSPMLWPPHITPALSIAISSQLTQRDDVKLLDFGLAKLDGPLPEEDADKTKVASPTTTTGFMMGTLAYVSHEQEVQTLLPTSFPLG